MRQKWAPPEIPTSPEIPIFRPPVILPPLPPLESAPVLLSPPPRLRQAVAALPGAEPPHGPLPEFSQLEEKGSETYAGQVALMAIGHSGLGIYLGTIQVKGNDIFYFDPNGTQHTLQSNPDGQTNILLGRAVENRRDSSQPKGSAKNAHVITINDNDVSRFHVSISIQDNTIQITDVSTYGTAAAELLWSNKNTQYKMGERTIKVRLPDSSVTIS